MVTKGEGRDYEAVSHPVGEKGNRFVEGKGCVGTK